MTAAEMDIIIGAEVQGAVNGLKTVNAQLIKTEQTAAQVTKKTSTNFTGLNRVIQDLPFGFIAISNNLEQLLPAAGALGLAFSAVISAVSFLQIGFRNWTHSTKDNTDALKENAEAQKKIIDSAGKEIGQLIVLTNAAKDTGLAMQVRLNAVKELQKEYPQYFGNLSKEKILQGDVAIAINDTTKALFAQAVVREKTSDLGPLAAQIFDLRQQREELEKQEATMKRMNALSGQKRNRQGIVSSLIGAGSQDRKGVTELAQQIAEIDKQLLPLQGKFKGLAQAIIDASKAAGTGLFSDDKKEKLKKELSDFFLVDTNIKDISKKFIDKIAVETGDNINKIMGPQGALTITPTIHVRPKIPSDELNALSQFLTDTLNKSVESIGEGIGNILAGASNPFSSFFAVVGEGLKTIGKQLIELGGLAVIVKKALSQIFTNPVAAIAAGVAAIALGTIIANKASKIQGFATGGVVTSPQLALVGEQGPEKIVPLGYENAASRMIKVEVEGFISNNVIRIANKRAEAVAFNTF